MTKQSHSSTPKQRQKIWYMHTIDHSPAAYDGEQICFLNCYGKWAAALLVPSLKQLRREQKASTAWRLSQGYSDTGYGYKKVRLP